MKFYHFTVPNIKNAGDCLLSDSVRILFDKEWGGQSWVVSPLRRETKESSISDVNKRFHGIIVGGGGLFLKDSNRNKNSGWQWNCPIDILKKIEKPLAIFGVGYNRFRKQGEFDPIFKKHINILAEKCCFFGLRNNGSINAIKKYLNNGHDKLKFQPCSTTLSRELYNVKKQGAWEKGEKTLGITMAFDRSNLRFAGKEQQILSKILEILEWAENNGWNVKIINQHDADMKHSWLKERAKKYEVVEICNNTPQKIVEIYNEIPLLLGMRGHSQLIPFGMNNAFISLISHDKLQFFLDDINHPEWGVEISDPKLEHKIISKIEYMDNNRGKIQKQINEAKAKFWNITRSNLEILKQKFQSNP